jgi:hypothetical protein
LSSLLDRIDCFELLYCNPERQILLGTILDQELSELCSLLAILQAIVAVTRLVDQSFKEAIDNRLGVADEWIDIG